MREEGYQEPRVSVSIGRKINLGGYESVDIWMGVLGIESGATEEQMLELLATGDRAFQLLKKNMAAKLKEVRERIKGEVT